MRLDDILATIGKNSELRESFISWCLAVEKKLDVKGSIRDQFTSPLVDAIYGHVPLESKKLQNGLQFEFVPNVGSKIPREFIMSEPRVPDHVWEPQTTKLLLHLSSIARNAVIGGAYFGDQAIPVANAMKLNGGVVHAFDLNSTQSEILSRNAAKNRLAENIRVVNKGLWSDSATYLDLSEGDDVAFATRVELSSGMKANTISIDEYVSENGLPAIDLIMLDIEGSELKVLEGAKKELSREMEMAPEIVFEIHRSYVDWSNGLSNTDIVKFLTSFGYNVFAVRDFQANFDLKGKPIELIPVPEAYLEGPPHGFNMLAVKDPSVIKNSLFRMCSNVSPKYIIHKDPTLHHPIDGLF